MEVRAPSIAFEASHNATAANSTGSLLKESTIVPWTVAYPLDPPKPEPPLCLPPDGLCAKAEREKRLIKIIIKFFIIVKSDFQRHKVK